MSLPWFVCLSVCEWDYAKMVAEFSWHSEKSTSSNQLDIGSGLKELLFLTVMWDKPCAYCAVLLIVIQILPTVKQWSKSLHRVTWAMPGADLRLTMWDHRYWVSAVCLLYNFCWRLLHLPTEWWPGWVYLDS